VGSSSSSKKHTGYTLTVIDLHGCLYRIQCSKRIPIDELTTFMDECPLMSNYYMSRGYSISNAIFYGENWQRTSVTIKGHILRHVDFDAKVFISARQMAKLKEFEQRAGTAGSTVGIIHTYPSKSPKELPIAPPAYSKAE